jgi:hypothetical protein
LDAVAQQAVDGLVIVVEAAIGIAGLAAKQIRRARDLRVCVTAVAKPGRADLVLDVAVRGVIGPVPQAAVTQLAAKQLDDAILRDALGGLRPASSQDFTRVKFTWSWLIGQHLAREDP